MHTKTEQETLQWRNSFEDPPTVLVGQNILQHVYAAGVKNVSAKAVHLRTALHVLIGGVVRAGGHGVFAEYEDNGRVQ